MTASVRSIGRWLKWVRGIGQTSAITQATGNVAPAADKAPEAVFETGHLLEAEAVRALLECHDIPAMIQREPVSQVYPFTVGDLATCRILVPAALADEARHLITESSAASPSGVEKEGISDESQDSPRWERE